MSGLLPGFARKRSPQHFATRRTSKVYSTSAHPLILAPGLGASPGIWWPKPSRHSAAVYRWAARQSKSNSALTSAGV